MYFSWEIMYYIFHNFFLKRKLQFNSRLDRNNWCVYHTRRIRKVVVLIWSLLTSRGLLGNGRRPFQVMVGLTFVCLSCVFILMRNMKRNKQGGKKINRSTYFCVWSLVLSLLPMPSPAFIPTLWVYCCLLGITPLAEQIHSFSSRIFPLLSGSCGSIAIYSNVSQSLTPPRANSIGNCQLFTIHVLSIYLYINIDTSINITCTHMCWYVHIYQPLLRFLKNYVYLWGQAHKHNCWWSQETGVGFSGTGVAGGCVLFNMSAGNWTQDLRKRNKIS